MLSMNIHDWTHWWMYNILWSTCIGSGKLASIWGEACKSLYTAGSLPFEMNLRDEGGAGGARRDRKFKVQIKYAARHDLHPLGVCCGGKRLDAPREALQVLDIVLLQLPTFRYVPFGRPFYDPGFGEKGREHFLSNGLTSWCRYYQSVRPKQMGLLLNIGVLVRTRR